MITIAQDFQIRATAVCNESDCESRYPDTDEVVIALWFGGEGLRRPDTYKPTKDGDILLCRNCGTQYEVKKDWPRTIETGSPAVPKFYARQG